MAYLHMMMIGRFPDPIWTLLTFPINSISEEVMGGVSCSGHTKKWNRETLNAVFTPTTPGWQDLDSSISKFLKL